MELDGILGPETTGDEHSESLEEVDSTGAVVVSARGTGSGGAGGGVVVSTNNDCGQNVSF